HFPVRVQCLNRVITQLGSRDSQNPRTGSQIQEGLLFVRVSLTSQLLQTKACGRMMSRTEAQARVEYDDDLAFARASAAPTRLDEQRVANLDRLEVMFPCFNPLLLFDLSDRERRRPNVQAAPLDLLQARSQRVQLEAGRAIFLRRIH